MSWLQPKTDRSVIVESITEVSGTLESKMSSTDERLAILMYPQTTHQLMKGDETNEEPEMVQVPASPKRSGDQQVELPDTSRAVEVRCSRGPGLLIVGLRLHHYTMGTGDPLVYKTGTAMEATKRTSRSCGSEWKVIAASDPLQMLLSLGLGIFFTNCAENGHQLVCGNGVPIPFLMNGLVNRMD